MSSVTWTDDPNDPCAYCVGWVEPDPMHSGNFEDAYPINADGSRVTRMFQNTHRSCEKSVMAYIAESRSL